MNAVLLLVLILFLLNMSEGFELNCTSSDECYCLETNLQYEFYCPVEIPQITVHVQPEEGVKIQCLKQDDGPPLPFFNWPHFNGLNEITFLKIELCSFPRNFSTLVERIIGISNLTTLEFFYDNQFENVSLDRDTFGNLSSLEAVTLSNFGGNQETARDLQLANDTFVNLPNLIKLDLTRNGLLSLDDKLFTNLSKLNKLYLRSNLLSNLSPTIFEGLQEMELLDLSFNHLEDLPKSLFKNLINLKYVNLMSNKLRIIPISLFETNYNLEVVRLNRNPLVRLFEFHFAHFLNLQEFGLSEAELTSLPNHLFEDSSNVLIIDLHSNNLASLPDDAFVGLHELQSLDLSFNKLQSLGQNLFGSLIDLLNLDLQYNLITNLNKDAFRKLNNLETINLKGNKLETLHQDLFRSAVNLQEIVLADNFLQFSDNTIRAFTSSPFIFNENLRILDLSHNHITAINNDWVLTKPYLEELDLSYNQITNLTFENVFALSEQILIDLTHNNISVVYFQDAIEITTEKMKHVSKKSINVLLNENPLNCNCFVYDFAKHLGGASIVSEFVQIEADNLTCSAPLSLYNSPIGDLDIDQLKCSFHELEMANCSSECTCSFRPADGAVLADCSNRNLTTYPFMRLPSRLNFRRAEVNLQNNSLVSGPFDGMGYENVTDLYLSYNSITELKWLPSKIESLELDHNKLSSLESTSVLNSSLLKSIKLGDNPWSCNCTTVNLFGFLITHLTTKNIDSNEIKCVNSNLKLIHLSSKELCPTPDYLIIGLSTTLVVSMMVICGLLIFYYRNEDKIKVWLFAHNIFLSCITEEEIDKDKMYDAFISYSHKDEDFVLNQLQKCLENEPNSYKLCLHIRDWVPGEVISDQIVKSINDSKRTVVVLSRNFLESVWGTSEFKIAHSKAMSEGRARVIVVLYGDVLDQELDETLKTYIRTNTYVKWGDPWFWEKLKYALPHSQKGVRIASVSYPATVISRQDKKQSGETTTSWTTNSEENSIVF